MCQQRAQVVLNDMPDTLVIDQVIAVDEHISQGDYLLVEAESFGGVAIEVSKAVRRLIDDLEVAFDGGAEHQIAAIFGQSVVSDELTNGRPACRISCNSLARLCGIERARPAVDLTDKVRLPVRSGADQVDRPVQQRF